MHISRPISLPETDFARRRPERGAVVAIVLFVLLALGGSLWLSQDGVAPCGEETLTAVCVMP